MPRTVVRTRLLESPAEGPPDTPPEGARFSTGEDLALLDGPTTAPVGAVIVDPDTDDLSDVTVAEPAGTTFYLLPGRHVLGGGSPGAFDQVIPKNGNTYVGAPKAVLDGRNVNQYAFTGPGSDVTIRYLEVANFACPFDEFVVNHDAAQGWTVEYCDFHNNGGAALGLGTDIVVRHCWLHHNRQYGFSCFKFAVDDGDTPSVTDVAIHLCEIHHNGDPRDEFEPDGDLTFRGRNGGCKFWDADGIVFTDSWIHHSYLTGVWADTNDIHMRLQGNLIEDNWGEGFFYEISYNFLVIGNTFRRNCIRKGLWRNYAGSGDPFPSPAIYISESGSEAAVGGLYAASSEITGNRFVNNWDDITLWENSDRFCNSPANTSSKIYKPQTGGASLAACNNPTGRNLTVTLISGSPNFTVTSGTLEFTDEGQFVSGTGIPGGTKIKEPTTANGFQGGYIDGTHGVLTANATSSGSVTMAVAAGTIDVGPANYDCRWHTQLVDIHDNVFEHNEAEVLGPNTLQGTVVTGKQAVISQYGTFPTWSPYQADTIQQAITFDQDNLWHGNIYRGDYNFMPFDTSNLLTYANWQDAPYGQDAGSTMDTNPPTGGGGGDNYRPAAPTAVSAVAGNGQARVFFTPPTDIGEDFIVGYEVTSSPGGVVATAVAGPVTVSGLTNDTAYTFTVKARNSMGLGTASGASNSVTPTGAGSLPGTMIPWHPIHVTARRKSATTAEVSFLVPSSDGGSAITSYEATSSPGGLTDSASRSPILVTGLTPGVPYTFTVTATNSIGTGPPSPETTPITLLEGDEQIAPGAVTVAATAGSLTVAHADPPFITSIAGTGATSYFADQYSQPIMLRAFSIWMLFSHAGRWTGTAESTIDDAIADLQTMGANALMVKTFSHTTFGSENDTGNTHDDIAPFVGGDISVLNDTFWDRFDYLLNAAAAAGITVLVNMAHATSDLASGGILDGESATNMGNYGEALGARYASFPNIIWMVGGDYFDSHETELDALIAGIQSQGDTHLVSVQNYAESTSRKDLFDNATLNTGLGLADFNFVYSYNVSYDGINHAFGESSPIPAAWMDGFYDQNNAGSRKLLRDQMWWCLSSGGRGSQYGSEGLWQWGSGAAAALGTETFPTNDLAGIWDAFAALSGWHQLVPDTNNSFLTAGRGTHAASFESGGGGDQYTPGDPQNGYVTAGVTPDGTLAVVYFPIDTTVTVDDTELVASYEVFWMDPVTGATTAESIASTYSPTGTNSLGGADRVLVFRAV